MSTPVVLYASFEHLADLARLRVDLLEETGAPLEHATRIGLLASTEAFFRGTLTSSDWVSWVVQFDGKVGAIGSLAFWNRPPYPGNPQGKDAYLLNMFTSPEFRGQGAASAILNSAIADARRRGVRKLVLHATEAGRRRYLRAGFLPSTAYMELALDAEP